MAYKSKIFFVAVALVAQLVSFGYAATATHESGADSLWQALPQPASETHFILVSFSPVVVESEIVATVAVYDDTATQRPADYSELYDTAGQLLAVRWFDRFGIERMAVDRGFLEEADKLEGVFVGVLEGELI